MEQRWFAGGDGLRLAATVAGPQHGVPVLLLGGIGQTRHSWRGIVPRLAKTGRLTIALDIRGHGQSDWSPSGDYGYAAQIGDVAAVVSALDRAVALVGHSLGGKIGIAAAATLGRDVIGALALVDSVPRSSPAGIGNVSRAVASPQEGFASPQAAAEAIAGARGQTAAANAGERMRRNLRIDAVGRWHWHWDTRYRLPQQRIGLGEGTAYLDSVASKISVPVLQAWCEHSDVVDASGVEALRRRVPQMEVEILRGASHMLTGDDNDHVGEVLLSFLDRSGF